MALVFCPSIGAGILRFLHLVHVCVSFASRILCFSVQVLSQKAMSTTVVPSTLPGNVPLSEHDPALYDLIEKEKVRLG